MPIRALVFDFDGLMVDTETSSYESWREIYAQHGADLSLDIWVDCIGRPGGYFDACTHLETLTGLTVDRQILRAEQKRRFNEMNLLQPLRPGVHDYLREAQRLGLSVGLASSATRNRVLAHLEQLRVLEYFSTTKCLEDTSRHKPDPEPFLAAAEALGVTPGEAVAFEDSPHGISSAKAAGMVCVAVPNAITRTLNFQEADILLESMALMTLEELMFRVSSHRDR
jgi:HAD superfamily hydrolase (TIGR01509 family)